MEETSVLAEQLAKSRRQRKSARVLVMDAAGRVLLFRFSHLDDALAGSGYWATPGGALEEGESYEAAARRELREETGIHAVSIGDPVGARSFSMGLPSGEQVEAYEQYYRVCVADNDVSSAGWSQQELEVIAEHRWWTAEEIASTREVIWPERLLELLTRSGGSS